MYYSHVLILSNARPLNLSSAGGGCTGTYICLDHLVQFIADYGFSAEIDILDFNISAGGDWTGTYICLDHLMQSIAKIDLIVLIPDTCLLP